MLPEHSQLINLILFPRGCWLCLHRHKSSDFDEEDLLLLVTFMGVFFKQAWCSERAELLFIPGRALPERVLGGHQHQNAVPIPRCAVFRRSRKHLRVLVLGGLSMRQIEENILSYPWASQSDLKGSTCIFQCRFLLVFPSNTGTSCMQLPIRRMEKRGKG